MKKVFIKIISSLKVLIKPWIIFFYLFLVFRFPSLWYLIIIFLFLHFHFSTDLQNRINNKYSNLFTIIAVLTFVGAYFSDKRDMHRDIISALNLENRSNQIVIDSIKSIEDNNERKLPLRSFQFFYSKQYWYKNIDYLTDQCLTDYAIYISNMESANRFIDMLWGAQQYVVETDSPIKEGGFDYTRQSLYRIIDWIVVDINKLKQCYKDNFFEDQSKKAN